MKTLFLLLPLALVSSVATAQVKDAALSDVQELSRRAEQTRLDIEITSAKITSSTESTVLPDLYLLRAEQRSDLARTLILLKQARQPNTPISELDLSAERRHKADAIEDYGTLMRLFPNYSRLDRVLFSKALEHGDLAEHDLKISTLRDLTQRFPKSELWSEAQYLIGSDLLDREKKAGAAFNEFKKITERPLGAFSALAKYKMGWCQISLSLFPEAFQSFTEVLALRQQTKMTDAPEEYRRTDIGQEALVAAIWPFTELEAAQRQKLGLRDALATFRKLSFDRSTYEGLLPRLARRLAVKGFQYQAAEVYAEHAVVSTDTRAAFDSAVAFYEIYKTSPKPDAFAVRSSLAFPELVERLIWLGHARRYAPVETAQQRKESQKVQSDLEVLSRDLLVDMSKRARDTGDRELSQRLVSIYDAHLWSFPKSPQRSAIRFNLAEILFSNQDFTRAAVEFERLALREKNKARALEMLKSSVEAYVNALKDANKLSPANKVISRSGLRFSAQVLAKQSPDPQVKASAGFNIAKSFYDERLFENAKTLLRRFVQDFPSHPLAAQAVTLLLDSSYQQQRFSELEQDARRLLAAPNLAASVKDRLRQTLQQAQMKTARSIAGDFGSDSYASEFLKMASANRGSAVGEKALLEAFKSLRSRNDPKALEIGAQYLGQYSSSPGAHEVALEMGRMAIIAADFRRAAFAFELFVKVRPNSPEAKELALQAARIFDQAGDIDRASALYQSLNDIDSQCQLFERARAWERLEGCAAKVQDWRSSYWRGLSAWRRGLKSQAQAHLNQALTAAPKELSPQDLDRFMHTSYLLYEVDFDRYQALRFEPTNPVPSIQKKKAAFDDLQQRLAGVQEIGSGRWALSALYSTGKLNLGFVQFLRSAQPPPQLSPAAAQKFKAGLEAQAKGFAQAAEKAFSQCVKLASEQMIFSRFAQGCASKGQVAVSESAEMDIQTGSRESRGDQISQLRVQIYRTPRNLDLLLRLADQFTSSADYSMALLVLLRAQEVAPTDPRPVSRAAMVHLFRNDWNSAGLDVQRALKLNAADGTANGIRNGIARHLGLSGMSRSPAGAIEGPVHPLLRSGGR